MGRPKREVAVKKQAKELDVTTNTVLDIKVTKEDVLSVLMQEEEERLEQELAVKVELFGSIEESRDLAKTAIENSIIAKPELSVFLDRSDISNSGFINFRDSFIQIDRFKQDKLPGFKSYNIPILETLTNPHKSNQKFTMVRPHVLKLHDTTASFNLIKNYTDSEGFLCMGSKKIGITLTSDEQTLIKEQIVKINKLEYKLAKLLPEINEIKYQILTLDTNRKFKNDLTKTILKKANLNKLLLK